ncbi:hypothetical protein BKA67DRAFT_105498 [Truncatella angustata]|uniref:Ubiquitin-like-conjugating enzyme ATG10 n=1 Tax=Truncatella angustata TaxID=152316 RepID=A0A9P8RIG8_9PEZI|nr:uncharacterized protein BKA67DRAFT_105498 [Truncatella angustata]KAH6646482.1 hypothetical protein BKA67DRAFT_105498 [Truncatella angustata]KAH8194932.1 hypothetical protein TruAng_010897 [Truncatella angustata]
MNQPAYHRYPFLSADEFAEVCHHLENKYCQATLGPVRKQWKLRLHRALDMSFGADSEYITFIQITRPLDESDDLDELESYMNSLSFTTGAAGMEWATDPEELVKQPSRPKIGHVIYEIHLHPTYQAPCLWFSLHDLPATDTAFDTETVFRRLVPDAFKGVLRGVGPVGGISADHHPVTGLPSFFVHPCFLGDAMTGFDCAKEEYLMVWLGLVGGCVGLWVPKEMALDQTR